MCGIYGVFNYGEAFPVKDIHNVIKWLGIASMERGTHATGIAYFYKNRLNISKAPKAADEFKFKLPLGVKTIIGHTRHATQGHQRKNSNNHPFAGHTKTQEFVLSHNGILFNDRELRKIKQLPATTIETDSYIAVQLLNKEKSINMDTIRSMAETVEGSFIFTILDDYNSLYIVKSNNPVSIIHFKELKTYFYASTEKILWSGLVYSSIFKMLKSQLLKNPHGVEEINLKDGQIIKIDSTGRVEYGNFKAIDTFGLCGSSYFNICYDRTYNSRIAVDDEYLEQLKTVALSLGYEPAIIDSLLNEGYYPSEIEEFIYADFPQEKLVESSI